jgi:hypothetical protein
VVQHGGIDRLRQPVETVGRHVRSEAERDDVDARAAGTPLDPEDPQRVIAGTGRIEDLGGRQVRCGCDAFHQLGDRTRADPVTHGDRRDVGAVAVVVIRGRSTVDVVHPRDRPLRVELLVVRVDTGVDDADLRPCSSRREVVLRRRDAEVAVRHIVERMDREILLDADDPRSVRHRPDLPRRETSHEPGDE